MEDSTDLYAILGVLPTAEDVVIRSAVRVLSQRYRPDRYPGDPAEAAARLQRIEEAYATLSDAARRREYDLRAAAEGSEAEYGDQAPAENLLDDPGWRADWDLACRFYPRLRDVESQFRALSPALAFTFCATLLENKRFPDGENIARQMEQAYLGRYFGDDPEILAFAKRLIVAGNAEAVATLSRALKVLGASTPASVIIETLSRDFGETPAEAPVGEAPAGEEPPSLESGWEEAFPPVEEIPDAAAETAEPAGAGELLEEPVAAQAVADDRVESPESVSPVTAAPGAPEPAVAEKATPEPAKPEAVSRPAPKQASEPPKASGKDLRKRSSLQSFLRAYRAGEGLDIDSAVSLVRALDGTVNLKRADALFGDVRVEVKFRGQNIMFSSGEFVEWVQRKILPEALGKF
jgi:hypothetical protein